MKNVLRNGACYQLIFVIFQLIGSYLEKKWNALELSFIGDIILKCGNAQKVAEVSHLALPLEQMIMDK